MRRFLTTLLCTALLAGVAPAALGVPDYVGDYFDGRAAFSENGKTGFLDEAGQVVVPAIYDDVRVYEGGYARVAQWADQTQYWGILDVEGNQVLPLEYGWIGERSEGLRAASLDGKWGYLDESFQVAIPYQFTGEAEDFDGGYARVAMLSADVGQLPLRGMIDRQGKLVVPCRYLGVAQPEGGLAYVQSWEELYGAVDVSTGEEAYPCRFRSKEALASTIGTGSSDPDRLWRETAQVCEEQGLDVTWYPEYEGMVRLYDIDRMLLQKNGVSGLYGMDGTEYAPPQFDEVRPFDENGEAAAMKGGKWGKIDRSGNVLTDFLYDTPAEVWEPVNAKMIQKNGIGPFAVATLDGKLITDYQYWNARPFSYGLAAVQNSEQKWGYVDAAGAEVIPCRYYGDRGGVGDFQADGFAILFDNAVDRAGRELLKGPQSTPWRAGCGLWGYMENGKVGFLDSQGNVAIPPRFAYVTDPKNLMRGNLFDETGVAQVWDNWGGEPYSIDLTGARVEATQKKAVRGDGLHSVLENGKYGFRDDAGKLAVPCLFDAVGEFQDGTAFVERDGVYGVLRDPRPVAEAFAAIAGDGLDVAWVETENDLNVLGSDNLVTEYHVLGRGGMMGMSTWGEYGLRSAEGTVIVPVGSMDSADMTQGRFITVGEELPDGDIRYTDFLGRSYLASELQGAWNPPELDTSREPGGEYDRLEDGKYFYADPWTGEKVLPAIYDEAYSFREGIGIARIGEEWFAIDRTGAKLFTLDAYSETGGWFHEGYLEVKDQATRKWGYVDQTGVLTIPARCDSCCWFSEGLAVIEKGGKYGYIDAAGNEVIPCVLDQAQEAQDGIAVLTFRGVQGILKNPLYREKTSDWAAAELGEADAAGYVTESCRDYQTFTITRRQFAELAVNYLEKTTGEAVNPAPADTFADAADESVLKAYAAGIVQGTGEGKFSPGMPLTREQLAAMLWRAMEKAGAAAGENADLTDYIDGGQVSGWAAESMAALVGRKVLEGTGEDALAPKTSCTVEQAVLLIWRAAK